MVNQPLQLLIKLISCQKKFQIYIEKLQHKSNEKNYYIIYSDYIFDFMSKKCFFKYLVQITGKRRTNNFTIGIKINLEDFMKVSSRQGGMCFCTCTRARCPDTHYLQRHISASLPLPAGRSPLALRATSSRSQRAASATLRCQQRRLRRRQFARRCQRQ